MKDKKLWIKIAVSVLVAIVLILALDILYSIIYKTNSIDDIFRNVEKEEAYLSEYIVYGTHLNIKGKLNIEGTSAVKGVNLRLDTINQENMQKIKLGYEISDTEIAFSTSDLINEGIDLESFKANTYYAIIEVEFVDGTCKYYSIKNDTDYKEVEYYTITKNDRNNKINIRFQKHNLNERNLNYMYISVSYAKLPEDVYDVVIDPGHGGSDPGAQYNGYSEANLTLKYALKVKEELEDLGLKVKITRDGTEDENFNTQSIYDEDGRVNVIGRSRAKFVFSIHLNSIEEPNKYGGVEIYAPTRANLNFAKDFADNIVNLADTNYSNLEVNYRMQDGVYVRTFRENELAESIETAKKVGFKPYEIKDYTPYLYMIRETGGIATGAYIDGRNTRFGQNLYYDSNIGLEAYLLEIGYINNKVDLQNILSNEEKYINAIVKTIKDNLLGEDYIAPERKEKNNNIR